MAIIFDFLMFAIYQNFIQKISESINNQNFLRLETRPTNILTH